MTSGDPRRFPECRACGRKMAGDYASHRGEVAPQSVSDPTRCKTCVAGGKE